MKPPTVETEGCHLPGEKKREKFGLPTSFLRSARFASSVLFLAIFDLSHLFFTLLVDC